MDSTPALMRTPSCKPPSMPVAGRHLMSADCLGKGQPTSTLSFSSQFCAGQLLVWNRNSRGGVAHCRKSMTVRNIGWDPEGILGAPQPGHLQRRAMVKDLKKAEEEKKQEELEAQREAERRRRAREARVVPSSDRELISFFLATEASELQWEVARCRSRLTPSFFLLMKEVAEAGMGSSAGELQAAEAVEKLLQKLQCEVDALDETQAAMVEAKGRLSKILAAKDKKETILSMAASNELDRSLLLLLDENIAAAVAANETRAAEFMEKVRMVVAKFVTV
eukprot:TRINITY_DN794_c0_g1_i4.p1 TRINITY_DN794_c0_g1~~TRINITY_DN794_c0_g1_i4.p1  ORF type:complete len:279 (+),score=93.23 TRINITY_DN794_c0_g1_i4:108-944(+)